MAQVIVTHVQGTFDIRWIKS